MNKAIEKYLRKRADLESRPIVGGPFEDVDQVVVIPALAEYDHLFATLATLATNPGGELGRTLVLCVVNNRAEPHATPDAIADNQRTLARLASHPPEALRLAYIDASSPGQELPPKGGVGLARKIGLDWGLSILARNEAGPGLLLSLDADTAVESNYLAVVREHFANRDAWAAVIAYAHRLGRSAEEDAAIVCYELFLRYHALGLHYARSPYAFHSIGSTMVCRAGAYAAVSGMNQRQAGEDFYFLQQLAKTGRVDQIAATTVYPSSRSSWRVPFGTGRRVARYLAGARHRAGGHDEYLVYDPESYRILREWLAFADADPGADPERCLATAARIHPQLHTFLEGHHFAKAWEGILRNSTNPVQAHAQFHRWFDGFRTMKLMHHLRDNALDEQDVFTSITTVLEWAGRPFVQASPRDMPGDLEAQRALLSYLRSLALGGANPVVVR